MIGEGYGRLRDGWESLRESYWFLPTVMAAGAGALALGIVEVDRALTASWLDRPAWIQDAGPEGTRAVLAAIAGSMITVTGVVFSIMIVALTLASSQFGPRLLRNFLRDRGNQFVLGTFVATFLYSLLVLRAVGQPENVPHLATALAVVLATLSIFVLIYFIHHAASSIQASSIIAAVVREMDGQVPHLFPSRVGEEAPDRPRPAQRDDLARLEEQGVEVRSVEEGYVTIVDPDAILALATEHDLLIRLYRRPGDFTTRDGPLCRVAPEARVTREVAESLRGGFVIGPRRTGVQDLGFLTEQLVEMAVRALSPGVNDPTTAVACVHRLGALVGRIANRELPSAFRVDDGGRLRVVVRQLSFAELVGGCFDPIRHYGGSDARVVVAALGRIEEAARRCESPDRRAILAEHASEFHEAHRAADGVSARDRFQVEEAYRQALIQLEADVPRRESKGADQRL